MNTRLKEQNWWLWLVDFNLMTVHMFPYRRLENGTLLHLSSILVPFHVLQKHQKFKSLISFWFFSVFLCLVHVRFISVICCLYGAVHTNTRVHVIPLTRLQ